MEKQRMMNIQVQLKNPAFKVLKYKKSNLLNQLKRLFNKMIRRILFLLKNQLI